MNIKTVFANGVSLLALLSMLASGQEAFAAGRGGAPVRAAAPAGHAMSAPRAAAPQMRAMPQMRMPQARTGGFQTFQRGGAQTFQRNPVGTNPALRGNP